MPEHNVDLAHQAFAAINSRDLDALLALMDPEVVALPRILSVEGGALRGHDGIREWWSSISSVRLAGTYVRQPPAIAMRDGENSPKGTADNGMCLKGAARLRFVVVLAALPLLAQRRTVPEVAARRRLIG